MADNQDVEMASPPNPMEPTESLKRPPPDVATTESAHPPQPILPGDSTMTRAEKYERQGGVRLNGDADDFEALPSKRVKLEDTNSGGDARDRRNGEAPIKAE